MTLRALALAFYAVLAALNRRAQERSVAVWRELDPLRLTASYADRESELLRLVSGAQLAAATQAGRYVPAAVRAQQVFDPPTAIINPERFAGIASDGRRLDSLLVQPVVATVTAIDRGAKPDEAMRVGERSLATIVETQVADAGRAATETAIAAEPKVRGYIRVLTPPSCGRCAILAGRIYKWSDGFERHPRCFPAGAVVSGPATRAASRRWYEGELSVVRTAGGKKLTVTGNHPVLTDRGWLPARLLVEGDQVVSSTRPDGAVGLGVPDERQIPSRIEDVWRAGRVDALRRMPVTPEDFHGDGTEGHVDVVPTDSLLRHRADVALLEQIRQPLLTFRSEPPITFTGTGTRSKLPLGVAPTSTSVMGGGRLGLALVGSLAGSSNEASLAGVADVYASVSQPLPDGRAAHPEAFGDGVLALAGLVGGHEGVDVQRQGLPRWDAPALPFAFENAAAYAERGRDLLYRITGQVTLDRVVENSRVGFAGHVYNLTSSEGWYSADGIIVSNCDCIHAPVVEGEEVPDGLTTDPMGYFNSLSRTEQDLLFGAGAAGAIRDGVDISRAVNAGRRGAGLSRPGAQKRRGSRAMPDELTDRARTRDEAVELLATAGFLTAA